MNHTKLYVALLLVLSASISLAAPADLSNEELVNQYYGVLSEADTNNDGMISNAEIEEITANRELAQEKTQALEEAEQRDLEFTVLENLEDSELATEYFSLFSEYDRNQDGTISTAELSEAGQNIGSISVKDLNAINEAWSRELNYTEEAEGLPTLSDSELARQYEDTFTKYDKDGNGKIDIPELGKAASDWSTGEEITDKELKAVIGAYTRTDFNYKEQDTQESHSGLKIRGKTLAGNYGRVKSYFTVEESREHVKSFEVNGEKVKSSFEIVDNSGESVTVEGDVGSKTFEVNLGDVDRDFEESFLPSTMYTWAEKAAEVNGKDLHLINCAEGSSGNKRIYVLAGHEGEGDHPAHIFQGEVRNVCGAWLGMSWGDALLKEKNLDVDTTSSTEGRVSSYVEEDEYIYLTEDTMTVTGSEEKNIEYELEIDTPSNTYQYDNVDLRHNGVLEIGGKNIDVYEDSLNGFFSDGEVAKIEDELYVKYMGKNDAFSAVKQFGFLYNISRDTGDDFNCEKYETSENQYKFCSNSGDGAEKEVDLGSTTTELNFVKNHYKQEGDEEYFVSTFITEDGNQVALTPEGEEVAGTKVSVVEWRGLTSNEGEKGQQAVIEVEPADNSAEVQFSKSEYALDETAELNIDIDEEGNYRLEVEGAGINREESIEESSKLELNPSETGEIEASLVIPEGFWIFGSNKILDTASTTVMEERGNENTDTGNLELGEIYTAEWGENVELAGEEFEVRVISYDSVSLGVQEGITNGINENSNRRLEFAGEMYYFHVCETDVDVRGREKTGNEEAEIAVTEQEISTSELCSKENDEELSDPSNYEMYDYSVGEVVELEAGQGLEFDGNELYIREIGIFDGESSSTTASAWADDIITDEEVQNTDTTAEEYDSHSFSIAEGFTSTQQFENGDYSIYPCSMSQESIEIIVKEEGESDIEENCPETENQEEGSGGEEPEESEGSGVEIELNTEDATTGQKVSVGITVLEEVANKGYQVEVGGPETFSESFGESESSFSFTPSAPGSYSIKVLPQTTGQNIPILGELLQGGALAETTINVRNPETERWKQYCQSQGYSTESLEQQTNCIEETLIPNYFQDTAEENTEPAESLCQNLLGYSYNPEQTSCQP